MAHPFGKPLVGTVVCVALLFAQGWIGAASAADPADDWPTWPRPKPPATDTAPPSPPAAAPPAPQAPAAPPEGKAAAKAGEEAGKKTAGGIKVGTTTKVLLVAAGIAGIAIGIGAGGGGSSSNH